MERHMLERDPALGGEFENEIKPGVGQARLVEPQAGEVEFDPLRVVFIGQFCDDMIGVRPVTQVEARIGGQRAIADQADIERDDVMS